MIEHTVLHLETLFTCYMSSIGFNELKYCTMKMTNVPPHIRLSYSFNLSITTIIHHFQKIKYAYRVICSEDLIVDSQSS